MKYISTKLRRGRPDPVAAIEAVEAFFGNEDIRVERLNALYLLRHSDPTSNNDQSRIAISRLKKLCVQVLSYTQGESAHTQLAAFKGIVMLTTRYIGLRQLFVDQLSLKLGPHPSPSDISNLWRKGSAGGHQEWNFFLDYAAYCISAPDSITKTVEAMMPREFGCILKEGLASCISNQLSNCISNSTRTATEHRRLTAIRYLGGILELPTFWNRRIENDPHSLSDGLCLIGIQLLEYIDFNCEEEGAVLPSGPDTLRLDPEGVHMMICATLRRLPLLLMPGDEIRSENSFEISGRLMLRLQSNRSKILFPEASNQAIVLLGQLAAKGLEADQKAQKQRKSIPWAQTKDSTRDAGESMPLDSEGGAHIARDKVAANIPHGFQGDAPERARGDRLPLHDQGGDDGSPDTPLMHSPYPVRSSSPEQMSESEVLEKVDADENARTEQEVTGSMAQTKDSARDSGENIRNTPRPELQDTGGPAKRIINVPSPTKPPSPVYARTFPSRTVTSIEEAMAIASDTRSVNSGGSRQSAGRKSTAIDISLPMSPHGLQTGGYSRPISPRSASQFSSGLKSRNSHKSGPPAEPIKISSLTSPHGPTRPSRTSRLD